MFTAFMNKVLTTADFSLIGLKLSIRLFKPVLIKSNTTLYLFYRLVLKRLLRSFNHIINTNRHSLSFMSKFMSKLLKGLSREKQRGFFAERNNAPKPPMLRFKTL